MRSFPALMALVVGTWTVSVAAVEQQGQPADGGSPRVDLGPDLLDGESAEKRLFDRLEAPARQPLGNSISDLIVYPHETPAANRTAQLEDRLERLEQRTAELLNRLEALVTRAPALPQPHPLGSRPAVRLAENSPHANNTPSAPHPQPSRQLAVKEFKSLEHQIQRRGAELRQKHQALQALQRDVAFSERYLEVLRQQHTHLRSLLGEPPKPAFSSPVHSPPVSPHSHAPSVLPNFDAAPPYLPPPRSAE